MKAGTAAESRGACSTVDPAPAGDVRGGRCRRGRCGTTCGTAARAPRGSAASGGRRCCRGRPRCAANAGRVRASSAGRPGSSLPWWATLRTSTGGSCERAGDVGLGVGGEQHVEARRRWRSPRRRGRWGRPRGASRAGAAAATAAGGGCRRARAAGPACAATAGVRRGSAALASACSSRRRRRGPAAGGTLRSDRRPPPSWSAWAWVSDERVEALDARLPQAREDGPPGGPVSNRIARRRAGAASRRPGRCRGRRREARRAGGGRARCRARARRRPRRSRRSGHQRAARHAGRAGATSRPPRPRSAATPGPRARAAPPARRRRRERRRAAEPHRQRRRGRLRGDVRDPLEVGEQRPRRARSAAPHSAGETCATAIATIPSHITGATAGAASEVGRQRGERDLLEVEAPSAARSRRVAAAVTAARRRPARAARARRSPSRQRGASASRPTTAANDSCQPGSPDARGLSASVAAAASPSAYQRDAGRPASAATSPAPPITPARWIDGPPPASGT